MGDVGEKQGLCERAGRQGERISSLYRLIFSKQSQSLWHIKITSDFSCIRRVQLMLAGLPHASVVQLARLHVCMLALLHGSLILLWSP